MRGYSKLNEKYFQLNINYNNTEKNLCVILHGNYMFIIGKLSKYDYNNCKFPIIFR